MTVTVEFVFFLLMFHVFCSTISRICLRNRIAILEKQLENLNNEDS